MFAPPAPPTDTVESLRAALALAQAEAAQAKARAVGAEMMVEHLQLEIAKLRREHFGQRSERGRNLLDQLELQLEELEERWPGLFGQGGAIFRWALCRLPWCAIAWASRREGVARLEGRPGNGGEIYAAASCGRF